MGVDAEMFVRTRRRYRENELRRLAGDMCAAFGPDRFFIDREGKYGDGPRYALSAIDVYEQDGDEIVPEPGESFIRVSLWTRYYGPDYERGDITFILGVADWLVRRTGGEVWYGGDSSGCCAQPLTPEYREELWAHFVAHGHAPYVERRNPYMPQPSLPFCDFCQHNLCEYGWGPSGTLVRCSGCNLRMRSVSDGTWTPFEVDKDGWPKKSAATAGQEGTDATT